MNATANNPFPKRTAFLLVGMALPLLLLGGTVTTLRVGMAVPDWPTTFGHNMFTYPFSEMIQNGGVFWEHTHRVWASLVGLATIALVVAHLRYETRRIARTLSIVALVLVIVQGVLGGMRVLENSPQLAFVHGSLAQALFALYGAVAVMHSRPWLAAEMRACKRTAGLRKIALATPVLVFAQIVLGAWLRHSGNMTALGLHVVVAALSTAAVIMLCRELRLSAEDGARGGHDRSHLLVIRKRLVLLLGLQLVLGILAAVWVYVVTGPHNPVSIGEAIFATAHVGVGAVLLLTCVSAAMWSHHVVSTGSGAHAIDSASLEGAR